MTLKPISLLMMIIAGGIAGIVQLMVVMKPISKIKMNSIEIEEDSRNKLRAVSWIQIREDITIGCYFDYMDSLVIAHDSLVPYPLSEHLLVHANPWILDTLAHTDYYLMKERDSFVYDQRKMIVLKSTDSIMIPDSLTTGHLLNSFKKTHLDVNIPEFKLRIYRDTTLLFTFPIRVGKNTKKYLAMADRITDLRTLSGSGKIIRVERNPIFYNPVDLKRFYRTKRDDKKTTLMPQIPWIETEINGLRNGQMIHPTTNPKTLGKASSNGCIGTREADAWVIYYNAPLGTAITIRYDLEVKNIEGDIIKLKDIYGYKK